MSIESFQFQVDKCIKVVLSCLSSCAAGLNESEMYKTSLRLFKIDLEEEIAKIKSYSVKEFIESSYVTDYYTENNATSGHPRYLLTDMIHCVEVDEHTNIFLPKEKFFFQLKPLQFWSSKFHRSKFEKILNFRFFQQESLYSRDYRDIVSNHQYKYDPKYDRVLDKSPRPANFNPRMVKPDFIPYRLRMRLREIFSNPEVINCCPVDIDEVPKMYRHFYNREIKHDCQSPAFEIFQILESLGSDVKFTYKISIEKATGDQYKYALVQPGNFLLESTLLDKLSRTGKSVNEKVDSYSVVVPFDDKFLKTQEYLWTVLHLSPNMITKSGKVVRKNYVESEAFGKVGISVENLLQIFQLVYKQRLPFDELGFLRADLCLMKILSKCCMFKNNKIYRLYEHFCKRLKNEMKKVNKNEI